MRIAILCSGRVAIPALEYLIKRGLVVAVAMPEKISETQTLVRHRCRQEGLPFRLFEKKDFNEKIITWLAAHQPDVVLVKTFPFLIPSGALAIPRHGFINFHYAPLPAWRGANPLFWMLRNGERQGGITVHEMNATYDTGDILLGRTIPIGHNINFGILYTQLAHAAVQLTAQLIEQLQTGTLQRKAQDHSKARWYGHPKHDDVFINWQTMEAEEIAGLVRACNPWNKGAATRWKTWTFGITHVSVVNSHVIAEPGSILSIDANPGFMIACKHAKAIIAEVVYCEEGFFPGYCMSAFGLKKNDQLTVSYELWAAKP
jgi:methionyl-tRNA formyltransferase